MCRDQSITSISCRIRGNGLISAVAAEQYQMGHRESKKEFLFDSEVEANASLLLLLRAIIWEEETHLSWLPRAAYPQRDSRKVSFGAGEMERGRAAHEDES